MISYKYGCCSNWRFHGSVIPAAFIFALPSALLGVAIKHLQYEKVWGYGWGTDATAIQPPAYAGFVGILGFLIIFRTSGAYGRFVSGSHTVDAMRVAMFDVAVSIVSDSAISKKDPAVVRQFQHDMIRLLSLLHAICISKLEGPSVSVGRLASLKVVDLHSLDPQALTTLRYYPQHMIMVVYSWIQSGVLDALDKGIIAVSPPIAGRIFAKLSDAMAKFEDCRMTALIPFPFPYAQASLWLLMVHYFVCPVFMCTLVDAENKNAESVFVFTFLQVFLLWSMVFISWQLENPFGSDANDLPLVANQERFNDRLCILLQPGVVACGPKFGNTLVDVNSRNALEELFDNEDFDSDEPDSRLL